jgi:predicted nucleic acid-binding protein
MGMRSLLFDTCFLIDLEREMKRGSAKAQAFLRANRDAKAFITWTVAGEFAEGFGDIKDPVCAAMLSRFEILPMDEATAGRYAQITAKLRRENQLIGTNDLWIAAAAMANAMELVTNNTGHFGRVVGLTVCGY